MNEIILKMEKITKVFPGVKALNEVNFSVYQGKVNALVGENGAGKSTLIKILAGVYEPDSGEIFLKGQKVRIRNPQDAIKKGIAVIYQELNLSPNLSAMENIMLGHEKRNKFGFLKNKENRNIASEWLNILGEGFISDFDNPVCNLSIAQQQMVEIAKALSLNAQIIVMDEPSATLTEKEIESLFNVVSRLRARGVTIIYISHRLDEIFRICDRVTILKDGEYISSVQISQIHKPELITMMIGRVLVNSYPQRSNGKKNECLLEVRNLSDGNMLKDISFKLYKGEILGISGLIGSGRTELARLIFGANKIQSGEIIVNGKAVRISSPQKAIKYGFGFATEDRKTEGLLLEMSIKDNLTISNMSKIASYGFINIGKEMKAVDKYIKHMKIKSTNQLQLVKNLSGGNQQKVILAKWLLTDAKVLILDEPTRGIDVGAKYEIYRIINELAENGIGIIIISSELPEILGISDRIIVMHEGGIAGEIIAAEATENKLMNLATGQTYINS